MPRPHLIRRSDVPYHASVQVNNREIFPVSFGTTWLVGCGALAQSAERYGAEIHAFVQMSNHLHILLSTPRENLDAVMRYFLSQMAARLHARSGRADHLFAARYKWSVLESSESVAYVYKYVLRNPVRAGICRSVSDYAYSSFWPSRALPVAIVEGMGAPWSAVPKAFEARLAWLDEPAPKELEELVARALRRAEFGFSRANGVQSALRKLRASYGVPMTR